MEQSNVQYWTLHQSHMRPFTNKEVDDYNAEKGGEDVYTTFAADSGEQTLISFGLESPHQHQSLSKST